MSAGRVSAEPIGPRASAGSRLLADPRHFQIAALSTLIGLGLFQFGFEVPWWHVAAVLGGTLGTQAIADRSVGRAFEPRSALISALSLTILLRTGSVWLSLGAAVLAVASKFLIRWRGKHIFNPANFGLVVVSLLFTGAWVSPGQWGVAPMLALGLFVMGLVVTGRAARWDISFALLGSYAALVFGRALWLGDPLAIPMHQMHSGALLVFAFFMISDPRTTPDARLGRVLYAALVALVGFSIQFGLYNSAGIILALILTAPLVPLFDRVFPAARHQWVRTLPVPARKTGEPHASFVPAE